MVSGDGLEEISRSTIECACCIGQAGRSSAAVPSSPLARALFQIARQTPIIRPMFLIVIGAIIGALFGSLPGAIIGGAIGYGIGVMLRQSVVGGLRIVQSQLIDTTFSVMGALCKADSVVTRDEIDAVKRTFGMLNLNAEQREQAKAAFNRGKQPDFDLDSAVDAFARMSRGRGPLLQLFMQLQIMAVAADGRIDPAEHAMLVRVARRLGLHESDVSQLEALLRAATDA